MGKCEVMNKEKDLINSVASQMWMSPPSNDSFCVCCSAEPNSPLCDKGIVQHGGELAHLLFARSLRRRLSINSMYSVEKSRTCQLSPSSQLLLSNVIFIQLFLYQHFFFLPLFFFSANKLVTRLTRQD